VIVRACIQGGSLPPANPRQSREVPDTNTEVPLQRIENALGHFLHFTRTPDGTLTDISATGGTRVHLGTSAV